MLSTNRLLTLTVHSESGRELTDLLLHMWLSLFIQVKEEKNN